MPRIVVIALLGRERGVDVIEGRGTSRKPRVGLLVNGGLVQSTARKTGILIGSIVGVRVETRTAGWSV